MKRFLWLLALLALVAGAQESPAPANPIEERLQVAYEALEKGDYEQAIQLFEDVVAEDWRNYDAHFGLGLAYLRSGNLKEAWFEFKQLTKLYPERFEGWYNLGVTYAELERWEEAAEALKKAVEVGKKAGLGPEVLKPAYLALAEAFLKLDRPEEAAKVLIEAREELGYDREVNIKLAEALLAARRYEDALPYLYEVLAEDRGNAEAVMLLADALAELELYERALKELDRSLAFAADDAARARILYKKAQVLARMGQDDEALALLEEAVAKDPGLWQAYYELGRLKLKKGDAEGALRAFLAAYEKNPEAPEVLLGLAAAYDVLGRYDEAYKVARLALERAQDEETRIKALFLLGKSAYLTGRYDEAISALKEVVAARENDARAWLYLGLALYANEDYGQAAMALERAAELDGRVEVLEYLGLAYLAAGRYADAERVLAEVVSRDPTRARAWYYLGLALWNLGREAEAERAFKKAKELGFAPPLAQER